MGSLKRRLRELPQRHGRKTLILLAAILLLGFALRAYRVVEPLPAPGDDAHAYYALSKSLYTEGSFGGPTFHDPSDWSPGAPLLYAAGFYATGGAREGTARIVELLLGLGSILVAYLLGRRISCRPAGLLAAFGVAVYPPFIHSVGALYSEPPAMLTLPAAVLAFLWAGDGLSSPSRNRAWARWLLPGLLFGLTAMFRPEYLLVGFALRAYRVVEPLPAPGDDAHAYYALSKSLYTEGS
ncbi:MAG TPA: glycosyltransferase family 39 protein, partial [Solirubrobacterales bacterium]|nr:glycosyltransferase family 39 protein [Solirubrobacterales bacterium]